METRKEMTHINTAATEATNSELMMRHGAGKCIARDTIIIEHIHRIIFWTQQNVAHVMQSVMFYINC